MRVLSWFGHVARMSGGRLTKRVYELKVGGSRGRGRPLKGWMKRMRDAVEKRGMTFENAKAVCQNGGEWRAIV